MGENHWKSIPVSILNLQQSWINFVCFLSCLCCIGDEAVYCHVMSYDLHSQVALEYMTPTWVHLFLSCSIYRLYYQDDISSWSWNREINQDKNNSTRKENIWIYLVIIYNQGIWFTIRLSQTLLRRTRIYLLESFQFCYSFAEMDNWRDVCTPSLEKITVVGLVWASEHIWCLYVNEIRPQCRWEQIWLGEQLNTAVSLCYICSNWLLTSCSPKSRTNIK